MAVWVLVEEYSPPKNFTIANGSAGTNVEKGTLMKITDPNTAAASAGDADVIAGVLAEEKIGGDGRTTASVYTDGLFKAVAGGNCTVGIGLMSYSSTGDANDVIDATNAGVGYKCLGTARETATDGQTLLVELRPGSNPGAYA